MSLRVSGALNWPHLCESLTAQPRSPINSLATSDSWPLFYGLCVRFSLPPRRSDLNRRRSAPVHLCTNTSVELVWSFQSKKAQNPDATRAYIRRPVYHLAVFEMFESYFIRCVNTSEPWNEPVRRQGGWMFVSPLPSLSFVLRQSRFCGGVWGMRCALRGEVNQAFLKSLWRRGASGSPHRITGAWTRAGAGHFSPFYCKKSSRNF